MNNPYEILGVKETDSIEHIENVYKSYIKLLHPDKENTAEVKRLNMSRKERTEFLIILQNAYKSIINSTKEVNYPDYKINYEIDETVRIGNMNDIKPGDSNNKFNAVFEKSKERDKKAGIVDAFSKGYSEFDSGRSFSNTNKVTAQSYSPDVDVTAAAVKKRTNTKDDRLVEYLPNIGFMDTELNFQELGIVNITNFGLSASGKGGMSATDLNDAYGNNYEVWEETVKRDKTLSEKFSDDASVKKRFMSQQLSRESIYNEPIDRNMLRAEARRNDIIEKQNKIRQANLGLYDSYYNDLNQGRLNE